LNKLIEVMTRVLGVDVDIDSSMETVDEWDSFNHVMLMIELKSEFNLDVSQEDFSRLTSVKDIMNMMSDKV
jgi:acyl carrier protein